MEPNKALEKIKKLLRLAGSSNPHEAAAAMRQARALMEKHGIGESDIALADVTEHGTGSGSKLKPAQWEANLGGTVAKAYSCKLFFAAGIGQWRFVGEMAEVASYTMAILLRQVRKARRDYIATELKRCKASTKTKRGDLFCDAWVWSVRKQVNQFAGSAQPSLAAEAYMVKHHPDLTTGQCTDRSKKGPLSNRDLGDVAKGIAAADGVQLNHGVGGSAPLALT
ncbi:DUF2786 domain-containing protein [Pseudomonas aeruginosa]